MKTFARFIEDFLIYKIVDEIDGDNNNGDIVEVNSDVSEANSNSQVYGNDEVGVVEVNTGDISNGLTEIIDLNYDGIDDKVEINEGTNANGEATNQTSIDYNNDGTIDLVEKRTVVNANGESGIKIELDFNNDDNYDESELIVESGDSYLIKEFKRDNENLLSEDLYNKSVSKNLVDGATDLNYNNIKEGINNNAYLVDDNNGTYDSKYQNELGISETDFSNLDITGNQFETFYSNFKGLYDLFAEEAAKK